MKPAYSANLLLGNVAILIRLALGVLRYGKQLKYLQLGHCLGNRLLYNFL